MLFIFGVLAWFPDTRMALYVGIGWLALLSLGYWLFVARQPVAVLADTARS
ncbi:putative proline-specific permease [compost metagenome]